MISDATPFSQETMDNLKACAIVCAVLTAFIIGTCLASAPKVTPTAYTISKPSQVTVEFGAEERTILLPAGAQIQVTIPAPKEPTPRGPTA